MKKYKVLTDNLDWFGIQKGAELVFADDLKIRVHNILEGGINPACWNVSDDDEFKIKMLLSRHPNWFQEVKEEGYYHKDEVVVLMRDAVSSCWGEFDIDKTQAKFNKFLTDNGFDYDRFW